MKTFQPGQIIWVLNVDADCCMCTELYSAKYVEALPNDRHVVSDTMGDTVCHLGTHLFASEQDALKARLFHVGKARARANAIIENAEVRLARLQAKDSQ